MTSSIHKRSSAGLPIPRLTRRIALTGGLGVAAAAALSACSQSSPEEQAYAAAAGELLVGASLELTGSGSTLGLLQNRALDVGADEINAVGIPFGGQRLRIRLIVEDNGGDPERAAAQARRLIDTERVSALIGGTTVETTKAMIAVAEPSKVPLLCLSSGDGITVPLPERRFIYQLGPNSSDVAERMSAAVRKHGLTDVAVLASADGHGAAGLAALPRALKSADRQLVDSRKLPKSNRAYEAVATALAELNPSAVIVWALAPTSGAAVAALRAAGYRGKIFLDPGAGADETLSGPNADAMEGTYIVHPSVLAGPPQRATTPSERAARAFIYRYIQKYGSFSGFAPYAADALRLLSTAARRGVSVEPQRLRGRLEAGPQEGIAGAYAFQPISHGGLEPDTLALFEVRRNAWVRLD